MITLDQGAPGSGIPVPVGGGISLQAALPIIQIPQVPSIGVLLYPPLVAGQNPDGVFNNLYVNNINIAGTQTGGGGGLTLPLTQNLTFSPDNTFDIGASAASRPRTIYAGTSVVTPILYSPSNIVELRNGTNPQSIFIDNTYTDASNLERMFVGWASNVFWISPNAVGSGSLNREIRLGGNGNNTISLYMGGNVIWYMDGATGHMIPQTNNSYDIGSNTNRVRNLYVGTSVLSSGSVGLSGGTLSLGGNSLFQWRYDANGNYTPIPDNTYNIGYAIQRVANIFTVGLQVYNGVTLGNTGGSTFGTLFSGTGVPGAGLGNNGDFYFRNDTPATANQRLYIKSAGAWVATAV